LFRPAVPSGHVPHDTTGRIVLTRAAYNARVAPLPVQIRTLCAIALCDLRVSAKTLARLADVHRNTASRWMRGQGGPLVLLTTLIANLEMRDINTRPILLACLRARRIVRELREDYR
jgi:hypothetical protein